MKRLAVFAVALVCVGAAPESDAEGMRSAGTEVLTSATVQSIEACIVHQVERGGRATVVDLPDGRSVHMALGGKGQAVMSFDIRDRGDQRALSARYRHPFSAKTATGFLSDAEKHCLPGAPTP